MSIDVIDSTQMEWLNGLDVLPTMPEGFRDNLGPTEQLETMLANYDVKPLFFDPETTRRIDLVNLRPGYIDLTDAFHESVEECFVLEGSVAVEENIVAGDYFWRPPGWVHSAESPDGLLALLMMEGVSQTDGSGPATRTIRPSSEFGTNPLSPDPHEANGPRGWIRKSSASRQAWQPGIAFARSEDSIDGVSLDAVSVKILSKNVHTGAQSLLMRLDPGFVQVASTQTATQYTYVIAGSVTVDGQRIGAGSFFERRGGLAFPTIATDDGAELFVKMNGYWSVQPT